jgi:hypothetical protein
MERVIQTAALTLAAIALFVSSAAAQRANSLEDGAWALQFGVEGDFISVDSFAGGLSLKRHFSPQSAFRVGINASAQDSNRDYSDVDIENGSDSWRTGINAIYQRYVKPDADAVVYWGVGPAFDYSHSSNTTTRGDSLSSESTSKTWSVGAEAMLGVEWFATRVISFHAEYVAGFDYYSQTNVYETNYYGVVDRRQENRDGWSSSLDSGVRFGLSVYF